MEQASDLIKAMTCGELDIERIARLLRECNSVDVLREVRSKAKAIETLQRERGAGLQLQLDAAEAALRAERRLGEFCRSEIHRGGDQKSNSAGGRLVLSDVGVSQSQSKRWQKLASVSEPVFEEHVRSVRCKGERLTTAGAIAAVSDAEQYDSDSWYTPKKYIEAARLVLGVIDLDPASSDEAQRTVKATEYFTAEQDGLAQKWYGNVWLNPPYSGALAKSFATKFCDEHDDGAIEAGIILVNNATDTAWCQRLLGIGVSCFTSGRVSFERDGKAHGGTRQGQIFVYVGDGRDVFVREFGAFGTVMEAL